MEYVKNAVTQKDLARRLGVSIGTIDRALHNRSGVSAKMRERIVAMADELSYSPNPYARALVSNRRTTVVDVITPKHSQFWWDLLDGVREAAEKWKEYNLEVHYREVLEGDIADELNAVRSILDTSPAGLLCVPFSPHILKDPIDKAVCAGVRVITVNRDCPDCGRICYVGENPYHFGSLCAKYYARFVHPGKQILVLSVVDNNVQKKKRTEGFIETLKAEAPDILVIPKYYTDTQYEVYQLAARALSSMNDLGGIFLNTSIGLCDAAQAVLDAGRAGDCFIMGIDITGATLELMDKKALPFTISQRPYLQGFTAMTKLCELLFISKMPVKEQYYVDFKVYAGREHYELSQFDQS